MYQALTAAFVAFLFALSFYWSSFSRQRKVSLMGYTGKHNLSSVQSPLQPSSPTPKKDVEEGTPELLRTASQLVRFDYQSVKPIPYRPFLSQHHLSIGISKCTKEDWIQIDRQYLDRVTERKKNLETYPDTCHAINSNFGANAITELFEKIVDHLPARFPTMFALDAGKCVFQNRVTGVQYNLEECRNEPRQMLRLLAENVEEDFYLMCPDNEGVFVMQGFVSCFTNSFFAPGKLGLSMKDIHGPVPDLENKIGKGINHSMKSMRGGSMVQRMGAKLTKSPMQWSLQFCGPDLFRTGGNNFYPDPGQDVDDLSEPQDLDACYLRVERQSLVRLPDTKAIVFCVRHYITPLEEIKREGNGQHLADAVQSMPEKLGYYKRRPFWQRDVERFLRA
ncbi:MAG: hypothetical protein LQ349_003579 [Xanthoria aureola]|nr:MAG: hypothetical protein LQ349_003579 [Xanthoria aureola]